MAIFTGAGVAIVTPFNEDKTVNFEELGRLIEFQIENKTDAIIICGTTGESSTMTDEEHLDTIKYCIEKVAGRVPVIAGTGSNNTADAVNLSKKAAEYGADGLLVVTPYYNKATQEGLYQYYKTIADAVDVPIIMYNVPSRTGTNILPQTAARIAKEIDNVVAIKEASGNISQVATLAALADGNLDIYSGNDDQVLPLLSLGGKGVISVWSNVAPAKVHDMCQAFFDGDIATATKLQLEGVDLCKALFCEVNPIPVKAAVSMIGFNAGPVRAPLTELSQQNVDTVKNALVNYGLEVK